MERTLNGTGLQLCMLKTGYIEFAMAGKYSTTGLSRAVADSEPRLPWQPWG